MKRLFTLTLLLLPILAFGQWRSDISGSWTGLLLQNEGGFAEQFELYMNLEQIGLSVKGTAYVRLGELQAEMKVSGFQTPDGSWRISELEILRNNKAGLTVAWCLKEYDLRADYRDGELVLTGPWWGNSEYGPCVPGSITLRKRIKVASLFRGENPVDVEPHG
ncbi:hypothetical protein [Neolewinella litorea]|uniref:Uncharacterized protein n=1 Tax=Neolewinella litorea TaxID=2562452 RepID=A0A4V3XLP1_9BACT|nr:hypothetical protein [Neolewinella litorea]THH41643.1 hypothetical protein E4021_03345 [Neolewinella litorea]